MKSVKSSNYSLSMKEIFSKYSVINEESAFEIEKQIHIFWSKILNDLCQSQNMEKSEAVIRKLYNVSARIGQSLATPENNALFSEWVYTGL